MSMNDWDEWVAFTETSNGGSKGGNNSSSGWNIALVIFLFLVALYKQLYVLIFAVVMMFVSVVVTHTVWNAVCRKHSQALNPYYRSASKIIAGFLTFFLVLAIWMSIQDFGAWGYFFEHVFVYILLVSFIVLAVVMFRIHQGREYEKAEHK